MAHPLRKIDQEFETKTSTLEFANHQEETLGKTWKPEPEEDNSFMIRCAQVELIDGRPRLSCRCSPTVINTCVLRMMIKQMKWQT